MGEIELKQERWRYPRFFTENVADDKIEARFKKGVLTISVPKKEPSPAKTRKIAIKG